MRNFFFFILVLYCSACVPVYKSITPDSFQFQSSALVPNISIEFQDTLLFPKQEKFSFIPVKVVNNSDQAFTLDNRSVSVFSNYEEVSFVESKKYLKSIRKKYWGYTLMASLGTIQTLGISSEGLMPGNTSAVGATMVGVAGFYILKTISYNRKQAKDLQLLDLNKQLVLPGQSKEGILVVDQANCSNISIRIE